MEDPVDLEQDRKEDVHQDQPVDYFVEKDKQYEQGQMRVPEMILE